MCTDNASSLPRKKPGGAGAVADKVKGLFDNTGLFDKTLPSVESALSRTPPEAIGQDSKAVLGHTVSEGLGNMYNGLVTFNTLSCCAGL